MQTTTIEYTCDICKKKVSDIKYRMILEFNDRPLGPVEKGFDICDDCIVGVLRYIRETFQLGG